MVFRQRELDHSQVSEHLQNTLLSGGQVRVEIDGRKTKLQLRRNDEFGWHVRQNRDAHAWKLRYCKVAYDKTSHPTRFLYLTVQGGLMEPQAMSKRELEPRNPNWNATLHEDDIVERRGRAARITIARKQLLRAARVLETVQTLREALQWLRAIEQQARRAQSQAADPIAALCARIAFLIEDIPD